MICLIIKKKVVYKKKIFVYIFLTPYQSKNECTALSNNPLNTKSNCFLVTNIIYYIISSKLVPELIIYLL